MKRKNWASWHWNQQCSQEHLVEIAYSIADWRAVSPYLGLTEADESAILESTHSVPARKMAMLRKWKQKQGAKATYKRLCQVFRKCGLCDIVWESHRTAECREVALQMKKVIWRWTKKWFLFTAKLIMYLLISQILYPAVNHLFSSPSSSEELLLSATSSSVTFSSISHKPHFLNTWHNRLYVAFAPCFCFHFLSIAIFRAGTECVDSSIALSSASVNWKIRRDCSPISNDARVGNFNQMLLTSVDALLIPASWPFLRCIVHLVRFTRLYMYCSWGESLKPRCIIGMSNNNHMSCQPDEQWYDTTTELTVWNSSWILPYANQLQPASDHRSKTVKRFQMKSTGCRDVQSTSKSK